MKITKFGQCCLLIELAGKRILTDPGRFTTAQNDLLDLDLILITHEHADHLHSASLEAIMRNNPNALIITNASVGGILEKLGFVYDTLAERTPTSVQGITIEAVPGQHAEIFEGYGQVENTGFFIENKLFYPGDAYTNPGRPVEVLALPVAGPWCKSADALSYAIAINPQKAFPVHDWLLNEYGISVVYGLFESILETHGVKFVPLKNNDTKEL